jgi:hypothetical protein
MKKEKTSDVEAICDQFNKLLSDKIGFDSKAQIKTRGKQGCKIHPNS